MRTSLTQAEPCSVPRSNGHKSKSLGSVRSRLDLPFHIFIAIAVLIAGAGCRRSGAFTYLSENKTATENRIVTPSDYVAGSGLDIQTPAGSIDAESDSSLKEIKITAKVSAFGKTDEEARARLQEVKVKTTRRPDGVLEIVAEFPKTDNGIAGDCSFVVRVPDAKGARLKTGNGSLTVKGLGGAAELDTSVGSITASDQGGNLSANSGNGSISITRTKGEVRASTSVGGLKIEGTSGAVSAKSGNGSIEVKSAGGDVKADTSVGSISIHDTAGAVTATGGNGSITIAGARNVKAKVSVGAVKIENAGGNVEAGSGNGSVVFNSAQDSNPSFKLETSVGSISVHLHASATGNIEAATSVGNVTINGSRKPESVTGERSSKKILLHESGPASRIQSGNGSITITLD